MVLSDIYKIFHSISAKYVLFASTHRTISRINHMLSHKTSLNKLKKVEIISSISSECNGMKLEANNWRKLGKFTNMWILNNTVLNNQWVKDETKRKKNLICRDK